MKMSCLGIIAVLLYLVSMPNAAIAEYAGTSNVYVSLVKYEPFPAEAGQFVDVWFKVENLGSGTTDNVTLELMPKFPFSLEADDAIKSTGPVTSGSAPLIKYHVKINEKATPGDNILQLRYKPAPLAGWVTKDIDIFIQAHDAILSVSDISAPPMVPGKVQTLSLSIKNLADSYLKDVAITLDFSSTTLPFAAINSVNEKRIVGIPPGDGTNISFDIITSPDATAGVYKVPLDIGYSDITNKTYARSYVIGLVVNPVPDYALSIQKYDVLTEGSSGTVTISVSNTGPGVIKFMTMGILPSQDYEVIGEKSIYLGNLNPDDYQTGAFKIYVNKAGGQGRTIPVNLALKYRDGLNNQYSKNMALDMRVYSGQEMSIYGLAPAGGSNTVLYGIVILIVIYLIYRKFFRKKVRTGV